MNQSIDIELLRRFEPVIHYTRGEHFFPMDVEPYIRACSLWVQRPNEEPTCLVPAGELTVAELAQPRSDEFGAVYYLRIANPLSPGELAAYEIKKRFSKNSDHDEQNTFRAGLGRLARVGYVARFADALFSLSLLARGRVPGDTAAAASIIYDQLMEDVDEANRYRYYGRVIRKNGWVALQYWFFYLFNNWRSGFYGVNDHEADWEMIYVYLSETKAGPIRPEWVAYATHDHAGDDLRRRWDDPELEKVGEHPVIYAGVGSHASYYTAGEYMVEIELPYMAPVTGIAGRVRNFWQEKLHQYNGQEDQPKKNGVAPLFSIPFVDYARGDGPSIGPGQPKEWAAPQLLDPAPAWAINYRGLWGLYTRDPMGGENAPSGPVYNRNGAVRQAWYDPLGWAGLDKVPTWEQALETALTRQVEIRAHQAALEATIEEKTEHLQRLGVETAAMRRKPHLEKLFEARQEEIGTLSQQIGQLRRELADEQAVLESLEQYSNGLQAGDLGPLRDHIRRARQPVSIEELRLGRIAEFWAAVSIGLMLLGFVALLMFSWQYLLWGLVSIISLFIFIESGFRGRLTNLVSSVATGLSLVAALILIYEFFWPVVSLVVLVTGGYILLDNLRELWA